jgi:hypothetical protein
MGMPAHFRPTGDNHNGCSRPFAASAILYTSSFVSICLGLTLPMLEILSRKIPVMPDTFIELLEWNPFSQLGLIFVLLGLSHFILAVMIDRRGA